MDNGAPEEIRTPDPQIRSLGWTIEIIEVRYRKKAATRGKLRISVALRMGSVTEKRLSQIIPP
jgi:hypothetical protein